MNQLFKKKEQSLTLSSCVCNAVHCAASEPTWKCQNSFFCVSVINRAAELPSRTSDISGFPMNWELIQTNSQRPQLWIQCFLRPLRGTVVPELILLVILGWFHIFRTISHPFFLSFGWVCSGGTCLLKYIILRLFIFALTGSERPAIRRIILVFLSFSESIPIVCLCPEQVLSGDTEEPMFWLKSTTGLQQIIQQTSLRTSENLDQGRNRVS